MKNIIFDLDGTIIDSHEGIQSSFDYAFEFIYNKKNSRTIKEFVGPPIHHILAEISGEKDPAILDKFLTSFKLNYDSEGYKQSFLYENMESVLKNLSALGHTLYICTNKRHVPTLKIIEFLSIGHWFKKVYCIDSEADFFGDKSALTKSIINNENLNKDDTFFIGDTKHDADAAFNNNLQFVFASYGFGKEEKAFYKNTISEPNEIFKIIKA